MTKQNQNKLKTYWMKIIDELKLRRRKDWDFLPVKIDLSSSDNKGVCFKRRENILKFVYSWFLLNKLEC